VKSSSVRHAKTNPSPMLQGGPEITIKTIDSFVVQCFLWTTFYGWKTRKNRKI